MKATIIALVVVGVMTVVLHYQNSETYEYAKSESTVEVIPEAWQTDEEAIQAAKDVIRKKELQAELESLQAVQASTTARIKDVQKELTTY